LKKLITIEALPKLLWVTFGIIGGLNSYSQGDFWISGLMFLIAAVNVFRLKGSFFKKDKNKIPK